MENVGFLSADPLVAISYRASLSDPDPLEQTRSHLYAVAARDRLRVVCGYHPTATVHWLGGPVHGSYCGIRQIAGMWRRFLDLRGSVSIGIEDLQVSLHPGETMVTAELVLRGPGDERVGYSTRRRRGLLLDEVWRFRSVPPG